MGIPLQFITDGKPDVDDNVNLPVCGSQEPCHNSVAIGVPDPVPHMQLPRVNGLGPGVQMITASGTS